MENITGTNGNDTLVANFEADTINGKAGNDTIITDSYSEYTLTGGAGNDQFVYNNFGFGPSPDTITDFGGVGKGTNPTAAVIAEVDTIKFLSPGLTARNLLLTQNGSNLEITFQSVVPNAKIILQNFVQENLDNLRKSTGATVNLGNIQFYGQTSISDSFDVINANSTQNNLFRKNTVTFFNDLNNYVNGFDNSDDVINGQGGDDKIDGLSGNDLLRGGAGNNTLIGGAGNDNLYAGFSTGDNLLSGGVGNDTLDVSASTGDNLLNGGDGNDYLLASGNDEYLGNGNIYYSLGNNTLNGGAGNDTLGLFLSEGDNLLIGGDGNDYLRNYSNKYELSGISGNNTIIGGAGNDSLGLSGITGDNLLIGGDGNDELFIYLYSDAGSNNTLQGGAGNDGLSINNSQGDNLLDGGDGNDSLSSAVPPNRYEFTSGNNTLNGGAGDDNFDVKFSTGNYLVSGGDGNDTIYMSPTGNDTIDGGTGDDLFSYNYNSFFTNLRFTEGITTIFNATTNIGSFTAGANRASYKNIERLDILGTDYDDNIVGSNGNDTLSGGNGGNDSLYGGAGTDTFAFFSLNEGIDRLYDFNATNELIQVLAGNFGGGLSIGSLSTSQFKIGASATTSEERFIYNGITGALYFDQDGSASRFTQVQFAQLSAGLSLTENNFVVI
ncbi:calcium-binding protein [Nostoc sp. CHAB 5784]|uniref:beta strand repeat-containing protein n=1 Tax=Nostoc mirabile TaxID=2907820 RepID=UPI001E502355|nr:calcium-binding protein [Nostoc mirabile]MCC5667337.1 calcium-binding protein [Nostoc mirabile CHAB5784]